MKLLRTAAVLLLVALATGGCAGRDGPDAAAVPTPAATTPAGPVPSSTAGGLPRPAADVGADGLTVRYQDADGRIKTLRVEDFER